MGTRADFYVGTGPTAKWLGSIAWDGYSVNEMKEKHADANEYNHACWAIKTATAESGYRNAVAALLTITRHSTIPNQGWPWPWNNSQTTDYTYAFAEGKCKTFCWGRPIEAESDSPQHEWPDMSARKNVTFGERSGVIFVGFN